METTPRGILALQTVLNHIVVTRQQLDDIVNGLPDEAIFALHDKLERKKYRILKKRREHLLSVLQSYNTGGWIVELGETYGIYLVEDGNDRYDEEVYKLDVRYGGHVSKIDLDTELLYRSKTMLAHLTLNDAQTLLACNLDTIKTGIAAIKQKQTVHKRKFASQLRVVCHSDWIHTPCGSRGAKRSFDRQYSLKTAAYTCEVRASYWRDTHNVYIERWVYPTGFIYYRFDNFSLSELFKVLAQSATTLDAYIRKTFGDGEHNLCHIPLDKLKKQAHLPVVQEELARRLL